MILGFFFYFQKKIQKQIFRIETWCRGSKPPCEEHLPEKFGGRLGSTPGGSIWGHDASVHSVFLVPIDSTQYQQEPQQQMINSSISVNQTKPAAIKNTDDCNKHIQPSSPPKKEKKTNPVPQPNNKPTGKCKPK